MRKRFRDWWRRVSGATWRESVTTALARLSEPPALPPTPLEYQRALQAVLAAHLRNLSKATSREEVHFERGICWALQHLIDAPARTRERETAAAIERERYEAEEREREEMEGNGHVRSGLGRRGSRP